MKKRVLAIFIALCLLVSGCTKLPSEEELNGRTASQSETENNAFKIYDSSSSSEESEGWIAQYIDHVLDNYQANANPGS